MIILRLYLCFVIFVSSGCFNQSDVVIIGKAENAKAGAVVISQDDKKMYYLDGIDSWNEKNVDKLVKVTGKLLVEKNEPPSKTEPIKQEIIGEKRIIQKPKWEFVK